MRLSLPADQTHNTHIHATWHTRLTFAALPVSNWLLHIQAAADGCLLYQQSLLPLPGWKTHIYRSSSLLAFYFGFSGTSFLSGRQTGTKQPDRLTRPKEPSSAASRQIICCSPETKTGGLFLAVWQIIKTQFPLTFIPKHIQDGCCT